MDSGVDDEDHRMDDAPRSPTTPYPFDVDGLHDGNEMSETTADSGPNSVVDMQESELPTRRGLLATGCCYDARMKMHLNADFSPNSHHPEDPRRVHEIFESFKRRGLIYMGPPDNLATVISQNPTRYMWRIPARYATSEEILLCHSRRHLEWVESIDQMSVAELREITNDFDNSRKSLYVGALSHYVARLSCGGAIDTCKAVVEGKVKNAFAVIRPPGHHAEHDDPMGFCFFNNVPVAVRVCQQDFPDQCRKTLILDWDVHHGNGIQNIFYDDPNVLYISLHVYGGGFYPGKPDDPSIPDGGIENCGSGAGIGKNVNIGWHAQGMGDGEYLAAFQKVVMPIAQEFDPDFVVISAGFDAAEGDTLGGCHVTPECYAHMTHMLMSLADGKMAVCLEGGYDLNAISLSAVAVAKTLMGEPPPKITIPPLNMEASKMLGRLQAYHASFWDCMRAAVFDQGIRANRQAGGMTLVDYMRTAQRQILSSKYRMVTLHMLKKSLQELHVNQVMVTPGVMDAKKLLVILHEPPEVHAEVDLGLDVEPQNSWVVDGVSGYIQWAVSSGFDVMDINVPGYKAPPDEPVLEGAEKLQAAKMQLRAHMQELMPYLWDNVLQISLANDIFVIGVGKAYAGVKELLLARPDSKERINGIISFVNGEIFSVRSDTDEGLVTWYRQHARLWVSYNHGCWIKEDLKKKIVKRRFGDARRSPQTGLNEMMEEHAPEAQQWMLDRCSPDSDAPEDNQEEK